jgi:GNAT superfamily N-acetyltransferase
MLSDRLTECLLKPDDAERGAALSREIGWSHTAETWENLIRWGGDGSFCLVDGDLLVATSIAVHYSPALAWIGVVITHPAYQRQGLARRMMETSIDYLRSKDTTCIMLDASEMGRPLYESMDFRALYRVNVFGGEAVESGAASDVRPVTAADLPMIIALDAEVVGVERSQIIHDLAQPGQCWVSGASGKIDGYLMVKRSNHGVSVGPWYHHTSAGAENLLRQALTSAHGQQIRLYIPEPNTDAQTLASTHGLTPIRFTTRMVLGDEPPGTMVRQYGVASLATG